MVNRLQHLQEFQQILGDYHISSANPVVREAKLVLLFGASATGRDSITQELVKTGHYRHLVSNTTRQPRVNNGVSEQNGVEYWFKTEEEMLEDLRQGRMLEAEIIHDQQVSGISLAELQRSIDEDKIAITNVDLNIINIIAAKPDAISILVLPPSLDEQLRRLNNRGDLHPQEVFRRIKTAAGIYRAGLEWSFLHYVVNDELSKAVKEVDMITHNQIDKRHDTDTKPLIRQLLDDANAWLADNQAVML